MAQHEEPPVRRPRKLLWLAIGGVVLSVTLLIAGTVFGHRFPRWTWSGVFDWQLVGLIVLVLSVVTVLLTLLIRAARSRPWTGFGDKTLWDWFQLLIIPLVLAIGGFWFATVQDNRQQELEDQRAQDTALQAYLDQMSELLLSGDLRGSEEGDEVRTLARARTLTVLERVEADREAQVLRFLFEAKLVNSSDPVISLAGADLQEAEIVTEKTERGRFPADWRGINLSGAYLRDAYMVFADLSGAYLSDTNLYEANLNWANLSRADLSGADPSFANLSYADLSGANLSGASLWYANLSDADLSGADLSGAELVGADLGYADLSGANLSGAILSDANLRDARGVTDEQITAAESLESAIMPNGQKYEDWLKSKDREKDGKKGTSS